MTGDMKGSRKAGTQIMSQWQFTPSASGFCQSSVTHSSQSIFPMLSDGTKYRYSQFHEARIEFSYLNWSFQVLPDPTKGLVGWQIFNQLFWRIIQSVTSTTSSPGPHSQINTVHSSSALCWHPLHWPQSHNILPWESIRGERIRYGQVVVKWLNSNKKNVS